MVMNATTLKDTRVTDRLKGYVKVKIQAEDVGAPETRAMMEHFGVMGLPTYVVLKAK